MRNWKGVGRVLKALTRPTSHRSDSHYTASVTNETVTCSKCIDHKSACERTNTKTDQHLRIRELLISTIMQPSSSATEGQFYRKPLPETCIPFASEEGKRVFKEALATDNMNCYFRLASQFRTQDEPAYCGLTTLVMVLNALEIDPGRVWKGPWKWYHENMLDCCIPTELVRKHGITFDEFVCLANCNSLDADYVRVDDSVDEETFRQVVKSLTTQEDTFLIVSYSRPALGQTGEGHFAPVSGYHAEKDLILILDTARFKYPPHWVALPLLFRSMRAIDQTTGLPRGYITVRASVDSKTLLLFKISDDFGISSSPETLASYQSFFTAWTHFLSRPIKLEGETQLENVVSEVLRGLLSSASALSAENILLTTQPHIHCSKMCKIQCVINSLLGSLEKSQIFKAMCTEVEKLEAADIGKLQKIFTVWPNTSVDCKGDRIVIKKRNEDKACKEKVCNLSQGMNLCHFISMFLLSWPYGNSYADDALGIVLPKVTQTVMGESSCSYLRDEVTSLRKQLSNLMEYHSPTNVSPRHTQHTT